MRAETCNYRDGVMRAGWGGPLHSGGLIPRLILCVCVFVCVLVCVCLLHLKAGRRSALDNIHRDF